MTELLHSSLNAVARLLGGWGSLRSGVRSGRAVLVLRSCEKDRIYPKRLVDESREDRTQGFEQFSRLSVREVEALQVFPIRLEIEKRERRGSDDGRDGFGVWRWRCGQGSRLVLNVVTFPSERRLSDEETDHGGNRFDRGGTSRSLQEPRRHGKHALRENPLPFRVGPFPLVSPYLSIGVGF
jgi:hypothetical protein